MANLQAILQAISQQRDLKQRKRETSLGVLQTGIEGLGAGIGARKGREHEAAESELERASRERMPGLTAQATVGAARDVQTDADTRLMEAYGTDNLADAISQHEAALSVAKEAGGQALMEFYATPAADAYKAHEIALREAGKAEQYIGTDLSGLSKRFAEVMETFGEDWFEPDSTKPLDREALRAEFAIDAELDEDPEGMMRLFDRMFRAGEEEITPPGEDTGILGNIPGNIQMMWDAMAGKVGKFGEKDPDITQEEIPYAQGLLRIIKEGKSLGTPLHGRAIDALFELGAKGTMRPTQRTAVGWSLERIKRLIAEAGGSFDAPAPATPLTATGSTGGRIERMTPDTAPRLSVDDSDAERVSRMQEFINLKGKEAAGTATPEELVRLRELEAGGGR